MNIERAQSAHEMEREQQQQQQTQQNGLMAEWKHEKSHGAKS